MRTPDRSPIKRGLATNDFEYSTENLMKNVANISSSNNLGLPGRRPKAKNLSRGF